MALGRRAFVALPFAALLAASPAGAEDLYKIDQHFGRIEFIVSHLGLFSSHGEFRHFDGKLVIDPEHPERTQIAVQVDAGSVAMPWEDATAMLRSPEFFDVQRFPEVRFTSTEVVAEPGNRFAIHGELEMRGVTKPLLLEAALVDRRLDPTRGMQVADFVVHGELKRSAFGMTSESAFISDRVELRIQAHIQVPEPPHAG
jgi:polyisoprenoid-binding protein YceI